MQKILPWLIGCVLLANAAVFVSGREGLDMEEQENALDELGGRQAWEWAMLHDPATGKIPEGARVRELAYLRSLQAAYPANKLRGDVWNSRGPWNVGGRTRALAIDVRNENHILTGGVSGGIWQTHDGGATWKKVSLPDAHPGCVSITQDPRPGKQDMWYALSGEIYGTSASGGGAFYLGDGAFVSLDNGDSWTPIASTAGGTPNSFTSNFQGGWRIVASPVDTVATCLYMATYGAVWRSTDTGKTWKMVLGNNSNSAYFSDVAVRSNGVVYATLSSTNATVKGFFRSADGVNFTDITPSFLKNWERMVIGLHPTRDEAFFIGEVPSDTSGGVVTTNYEGTKEYVALMRYQYVSGNGAGAGGVWENRSANLPTDAASSFDRFNSQGGYNLMVRVQPNTDYVVIGGTNLYISTDGFTSKNNTTQIGGYSLGSTIGSWGVYMNHHPDQHDLLFSASNPMQAWSVSDGGIRKTKALKPGNTIWEDISYGYITSQFYSVTIDKSKPFDSWMLGGLQDNGNYVVRSRNLKSGWKMTINGDGAYNYIAPNRSFYIISTQLGNTRKVILDEQGNVLSRRRIDPDGYDKSVYNFINPLAVDPNGDDILYMPVGARLGRLKGIKALPVNGDVTKLKDRWEFTDSVVVSSNVAAEITTLAVSANSHTIYVGTNNRDVFRINNAHEGKMTMTPLSTFRLPSGGFVSSIAIDPDDDNKVFVCYSNYNVNSLFYSSDGGTTWLLVGGNLEGTVNSTGANPSLRCIAILKDDAGKKHYFCGTSVGFFSTDTLKPGTSGANFTVWKQESPEGIGSAVVTDIQTRNSDGYVAVATHGSGIFEAYYTGKTPPNEPDPLMNNYSVYPNPARDVVNLSFEIDGLTPIKIDLVNLQGQVIKTLIEGNYNTGSYTIPVSIRDLPNGYYLAPLYRYGRKVQQTRRILVQH